MTDASSPADGSKADHASTGAGPTAPSSVVPTAAFGSTGHDSSRVLFGAAALGSMSQETADRTLALLEPAGINHIDTAASYGDSELRLAPFLADRGDNFFLATKTGERSGRQARAELERSLERLGVDSVDLVQLHNLVEDDEWDTAFGSGGAVEALAQARDEGLCRFIGVTGHGVRIPGMHRRSLEAFPFDSVLFPLNYSLMSQPDYRAEVEALSETCVSRGVAMQTIKSVARRRWPERTGQEYSWYEPLSDEAAIDRAVRWVLGQAVGDTTPYFVNTSSDARLLPLFVAAATGSLKPPSDDEMQADQAKFDVTPLFDGDELERI